MTIWALGVGVSPANGQTSSWNPVVGERHEITKSYETTNEGSGSSGSSQGQNTIEERVVSIRAEGVELEYDLPSSATPADRAREWMFPARMIRQSGGALRLLNRQELEARLDGWLRAAKWTREMCGRLIFTWNAFRIECDPEAVVGVVKAYDLLAVDLRDGATLRLPDARRAGVLSQNSRTNGLTFTMTVEADPDVVRRARAESDVAVGEIMRKPVTLDAALSKRSDERISGTIAVTFESDLYGNPRRQTRVTRLEIVGMEGRETQTRTDTLERRPIAATGGQSSRR